MAIGVWEPDQGERSAPEVELAQLRRFIAVAREGGLDDLASALPGEDLRRGAGLMQLDRSAWAVAEQLTVEELEALIRFFTMAEMELPGWEGGKRSPVISLVAILRERDRFTPELRRWIKRNTDNRYLPYGSLLQA